MSSTRGSASATGINHDSDPVMLWSRQERTAPVEWDDCTRVDHPAERQPAQAQPRLNRGRKRYTLDDPICGELLKVV